MNECAWDRPTALALVLMLAANCAVHLALLHAAPYLDEGDFTSSGYWLSRGSIFYRDTWNERAPLVYYLTALWFLIAPATLTSARLLALFLSSGQILLVFAVARRWFARGPALLAAGYFLAWHAWYLGTLYLSEQVTGTLVLLAVLALAGAEREAIPPRRAALAGAALSLLVMAKQSGIVLFLAAAIYVHRRARGLRPYLAAAALVWLPLLAYYAAAGELRTLTWGVLFPITEYGTRAYARLPSSADLAAFAPHLAVIFAFWAGPAARGQPWTSLSLLWMLGVFALSAPAFFYYHMLLGLPPAAIAFSAIFDHAWRARRHAAFAAYVVLFLLLAAAGVRASARRVAAYYDFDRWEEMKAVAARIAEWTRPEEPIWVFPHESNLYLFADRRAASRFPFLLPWTASPRVVAEVLASLEAKRPPVIVFTQHYRDTSPALPPARFAGPILDYVAAHYRVAGVSGPGLVLLRRMGEDASASPVKAEETHRVLFLEGPNALGGIPRF